MYTRLLNKSVIPDEATIREHLGEENHKLLAELENRLQGDNQLSRELKFPFGSSYAFFEKNAFTVTLQIGDKQVSLLENQMASLIQKTQDLWKNRYPCGERGGWVHYRVLTNEDLADVMKLLAIKKKPFTNKQL